MTIYTKIGFGGHRIVLDETGATLATFSHSDEGKALFGFFLAGLAADPTSIAVFDEDNCRFVVGDVAQLDA
jgi:hypothetical protein